MSATDAPETDPTVLRIEGEMTAYQAHELKQTLLAGLSTSTTLDLSAVSAIDTAGVQLLLLASRTAAEAQKSLRIARISPAVSKVLTLFNLNAHLNVAA